MGSQRQRQCETHAKTPYSDGDVWHCRGRRKSGIVTDRPGRPRRRGLQEKREEPRRSSAVAAGTKNADGGPAWHRSEEHTSELQSRGHLVCRLLLEKKKKRK